MKKIVLLLTALLILSTLAYADVGVGIWGRTVFNLAYGSDTPEDYDARIYQGWGPDWGNGTMMGIAVWWSNDIMEYHFKLKYHNNGKKNVTVNTEVNDLSVPPVPIGTGTGTVEIFQAEIPEAYGIIKLMPDLGLTLQLGYREEQNDFRETTPVTFHDMNAGNCGRLNGWAATIMVAPPDMGLNVGVQWRMPLGGGAAGLNDLPIQYNINNVGIAASYTMPDMVKVTVGTTIDGQEWQGDNDALFPKQTRNIFGRIHLLMVPDLTLWLLVKYTGLEPASEDQEMIDIDGDGTDETAGPVNDNNVIELLLGAKYVMGDFSVAGGADITMTTPKDTDIDGATAIEVNVDPAYNLGKVVIGGVFGMKMTMIKDVDISPTIYIEPYVKIPDFSMNIAFKYAMNNDQNEDTDDFTWSLPIQVDFSFW
ncbi:MAG: hypothetical protein JXB88_02305 [Spirochaetales bacterium]|nr:hypothetical protein [Spirochaetales bacterium]